MNKNGKFIHLKVPWEAKGEIYSESSRQKSALASLGKIHEGIVGG